MEGVIMNLRQFLFVLAAASCLGCQVDGLLSFDLQLLMSPLSNSSLQVDAEGRTYLIAGTQLLRLSKDLQLEQNVTLPDTAATLSLSPDGQRLLVCLNGMMDRSCVVYNTDNMTAQPVDTTLSLLSDPNNPNRPISAVSFSTDGSFYIGSYVSVAASSRVGMMKLSQYIYGDGTGSPIIRSEDYNAVTTGFVRIFLFGFVNGAYAYFVVVDPLVEADFRVMRVCHATSCPGNAASCGINALYEQDIQCGIPTSRFGTELLCGASVIDNFGATTGSSMVVSRCRQGRASDNNVCLFNFTAINDNMDMRYDGCRAESIQDTRVAWDNDVLCRTQSFTDRCNFANPLGGAGNGNIGDDPALSTIQGTIIINIGNQITTSLAIQVDGLSIVVVAYSKNSGTSHFAGFLERDGGSAVGINDAFKEDSVPSPLRSLQWQSDLDYIYASSDINVVRIPLEECSMNRNCFSCVSDRNPLCGWCVVENKCSRISECADGNSTSDRWIRANSTADNSSLCISFSVTPDQYLLDDQEILSVSVSGPGLPALLPNESYSCHLVDNEGRYNITVPAIAVSEGVNYSCDITKATFNYMGIQSVINFSFISSRAMVPFDTTSNALTVYRCSAANRCTDCLQTENACGWCVINKLCRGTTMECTTSSNFLQLMTGETFEDVCPLLLNESNGYSQHVRVPTDLQLITSNLPPIESNFAYQCDIGGRRLPATRNNATSLTCSVVSDQLSLTNTASDVSINVVSLRIFWTNDGSVNHAIDTLGPVDVTLYDCFTMATDCSACVNTRIDTSFQCGWCGTSSCRVSEECSSSLIIMGGQCPGPFISSISPTSGPPQGGTVITINGQNLGVTFIDFNASNSIILSGNGANVECVPLSEGYMSGTLVRCRTMAVPNEGMYTLLVTLQRSSGPQVGTSPFAILLPTIASVNPLRGPIAGGTLLTTTGTFLNTGLNAVVRLDGGNGPICVGVYRNETLITCTTPSVNSSATGNIIVIFDNQTVQPDTAIEFTYRDNPTFTSIQPQRTILEGGIIVTVFGTNLDVAQNPQLIFNQGNGETQSTCTVVNSTIMTCITPEIMAVPGVMISYVLRLDNAPPPNISSNTLTLMAVANPTVTSFTPNSVLRSAIELATSSTLLMLQGENFLSVEKDEIQVEIGGAVCEINRIGAREIDCVIPTNPMLDNQQTALVNVSFGRNIVIVLTERLSVTSSPGVNIYLIVGVVAAGVFVLLVFCCMVIAIIICFSRKQSKKKELQYTSLIAKMELLEVEMADECKRAFTELQTDLADLVQISDQNLPYRDFRTFAMRFLFPKAAMDHPVLCPLVVDGIKMKKEEVIKQLEIFQQLLLDKKFLLVFIRTLEADGSFTLQDKCNVASLLMVIFQNDLDYATEILQTLLAELMRKTIAKSHPKLLLRRTETVGEKMLANWLAFLLFPYILEHAGEPLFILFRAIKSQLEKGPVDIVTGEAKNSLSEEKLLRQHMEVKPVEGVVQHEDEEVPIKLWDCDSITQAKEKILDVLYRNTPVSKRPQLREIDLELIGKGDNGIILRDQDATNKREGEWVKVNTLGHFNLEEMSKLHDENPKNPVPRFRLVPRRATSMTNNYDTLGTIIANMSAADRNSKNMSVSELSSMFHLVKPETDDAEGAGGQKIMSEVFLTRLLSTKRILQPYVDKLFQAIFAVPHGRVMPKAIKCLFDFLDLQASELGITDSEVLHSWKTNSVPLRFWVNVIKNPDFVFDINKSATVDSCLTVIAQAYIDATSTADIKYTKDTPSARLLYVNEVKEYKQSVATYYSTVQSLPKLSNSEMAEYLRETAQVCAQSIANKEGLGAESASDHSYPASMTRRLYFVTDSALFELFKFASHYSDDVIDALNEEGLALLATNFDQIRKSLS